MKRRTRTEAIILHHTETRRDADVEAIRRDHLGRGWGDIGYHWLVRLGQPVKGRGEYLEGSHAPGWNGRSIGVALVGDYRHELPSEDDLEVVLGLIVDLRTRYGARLRILSHREAMEEIGRHDYTDCPGQVAWVDWIRDRLPADGPRGIL